MSKALLILGLALVVAVVAAAGSADAGDEPEFYVIVHPSNGAQSLSRKQVSDAFLKKVTRWGDDSAIAPVDQKPRREVRAHFSRAMLGRSVAAVLAYWRQIVFSGRGVPPRQVRNDGQVVRYVRANRGAIGYVARGTPLEGVKVVQVR